MISANDTEPGNRQALGRVSLCQNERAVLGVPAARIVGIVQLGDSWTHSHPSMISRKQLTGAANLCHDHLSHAWAAGAGLKQIEQVMARQGEAAWMHPKILWDFNMRFLSNTSCGVVAAWHLRE